MAVVEAVGVLEWPMEHLHVLSLGCSEELLKVPLSAGWATLAPNAVDLLMLGQSRCSIGTAKILLRDAERRRLYRYDHVVNKGEFALDSTDDVGRLMGIGTGSARSALPEVAQVFMQQKKQPFVPHHGPQRINEQTVAASPTATRR